MDRYTFLFGSLLTLCIYAAIYLYRPDLRDRMRRYGLYIGIWSVVTSYFIWTQDWWRPMTVTGTRTGVEDFIFGFAIGGILIAGYEAVMGRRLHPDPGLDGGWVRTRQLMALVVGVFGAVYVSGQPSWIAWGLAALTATIFELYHRPDLVPASLGTGALALVVAVVVYQAALLFNPDLVAQTYLLEHLSGYLVLGIPVEEYLWFLTTGLLMGPYYALYSNARLVDRSGAADVR